MRLSTIIIISLVLLATSPFAFAGNLTAKQIAERMDSLLRGKTNHSLTEMRIITPRWKRTLLMEIWADGHDKSFIHILKPARERDITFLKKGKLLYQYLPSVEMRIKISPSMMMQSWMGSNFTNDDLVKESSIVDDYEHTLLETERLDGKQYFKLKLIPKSDAAIVWDKIIVWVDTDTFLPLRQDFYDEKGRLVRTIRFSRVQQVNDRLYPMEMTLIPHNKKGHKTVLVTRRIEFNKKINKRVFSLKNLEKPR